jgi:hypothetical protein
MNPLTLTWVESRRDPTIEGFGTIINFQDYLFMSYHNYVCATERGFTDPGTSAKCVSAKFKNRCGVFYVL